MAGIPPSLTLRAHRILGGRDIVDDVSRSVHEVTLDHKLPMKRWNEVTSSQQTNYQDMTDDDILSASEKVQWQRQPQFAQEPRVRGVL